MKLSKNLIQVLICALVLTLSSLAHAEIWLSGGLFYNTEDTTTSPGGSTSKRDKSYSTYQGGYIFSNKVYLGGLYELDTIDKGGSNKETITGYGATLGYIFQSGWYVHGSYLASATYDLGSSQKWTKGTGYQFDLGYKFEVMSPFSIAFQMSDRTIDFKSFNNGVTDDDSQSYKLAEIFPQIKFVFIF